MSRTDPYAGLRPRRLAPICGLFTGAAVAAGIISAMDSRYGWWYLLTGPAAYVLMQAIFRISTAVEGLPARRGNWLFIP